MAEGHVPPPGTSSAGFRPGDDEARPVLQPNEVSEPHRRRNQLIGLLAALGEPMMNSFLLVCVCVCGLYWCRTTSFGVDHSTPTLGGLTGLMGLRLRLWQCQRLSLIEWHPPLCCTSTTTKLSLGGRSLWRMGLTSTRIKSVELASNDLLLLLFWCCRWCCCVIPLPEGSVA